MDPTPMDMTLAVHNEQCQELLSFFASAHLAEHLQAVSRPFAELALVLMHNLPNSAQKVMALEHLLIAKDAAVRSHVRTE